MWLKPSDHTPYVKAHTTNWRQFLRDYAKSSTKIILKKCLIFDADGKFQKMKIMLEIVFKETPTRRATAVAAAHFPYYDGGKRKIKTN